QFLAISYNAAAAQERGTCSQARSQCGTQPVCQRRYQACMETGCWIVGPLKRCGYQPQWSGCGKPPPAKLGTLTTKVVLPTAAYGSIPRFGWSRRTGSVATSALMAAF